MKKISRVMIVVSVVVSVCALGYIFIAVTQTGVGIDDKKAHQKSETQGYRTSEMAIAAKKRPKVTQATHILNGFFGAMLDYRNQSTFDSRTTLAKQFATPEAIQESTMFQPDRAKLVTQLNQQSKLDQVQFFPKQLDSGMLQGQVLVTNTATEGKDETQQGKIVKGYEVVVDTAQQKVTKVRPLGRFNVQTDSDALSDE